MTTKTYAEWIASYVASIGPLILGRCASATTMMVEAFPELVRVPGHVQCAWGRRAHWWCVTPDGQIVDPTVSQFPGGLGGIERYEPWEPGEPVRVGRCMECGDDIMATPQRLDEPPPMPRSFCGDACAIAMANEETR